MLRRLLVPLACAAAIAILSGCGADNVSAASDAKRQDTGSPSAAEPSGSSEPSSSAPTDPAETGLTLEDACALIDIDTWQNMTETSLLPDDPEAAGEDNRADPTDTDDFATCTLYYREPDGFYAPVRAWISKPGKGIPVGEGQPIDVARGRCWDSQNMTGDVSCTVGPYEVFLSMRLPYPQTQPLIDFAVENASALY